MDKPGRGCDEAAGPTWPSVDSALAPRLTSVVVKDPSELPPLHPGSGPQRPSLTCLHEWCSASVWLLSPPPQTCGRQLPSSRALPRARSQARHPTHSLTFMGSQRRESEHSHRAEQEAGAQNSNSRASGSSGEAPRACSLACREGSWLGMCCAGPPGASGSHTLCRPCCHPSHALSCFSSAECLEQLPRPLSEALGEESGCSPSLAGQLGCLRTPSSPGAALFGSDPGRNRPLQETLPAPVPPQALSN